MSLRLTFQRITFAIFSVLIFTHIGFAQSIAAKIENKLQYPGQIKITVIRETRCVELAK